MKKLIAVILSVLIVVMSFLAYDLYRGLDKGEKEGTPSPLPSPLPTLQTDPQDEYIKKLIASMTIEEKIGQLFYVRYDGSDDALDLNVGGIILFGNDFKGKSKDEVIAMIDHLKENSAVPLFIGTDEEGGIVNRISLNSELKETPFRSMQDLYREGSFEAIRQDTIEKCELLKELGLNMNFAPVADVSEDANDYIYLRTLGEDAKTTAEYVKIVTEVMAQEGILSCLKHFPGYGANVDTHSAIGNDKRELATFIENDLIPFEEGIKSGADFILISHNIVDAFDSEYPASLSAKVHTFLEEELGFKGLMITDDLVMQGITDLYGSREAAVIAFEAGNDMLLATDYKVQIQALIDAYNEGRISQERIDQSLYKILDTKISKGLITID